MPDQKCPICEGFDKDNHFTCPECNREYICNAHYDVDELVCSECTEKHKEEDKKKKPVKPASSAPAAEPAVSSTTAEAKSPFYFKKMSCPVCGGLTDNRFFKPKIYSERKVDMDKHVLLYSWTEPEFKKYHPPLYLFWHCPNCKYTAEKIDFEKPMRDSWSNFRTLKDAFPDKKQEDRTAEKIISWLSKDIDYEHMNYPIAFKIHALAIYIQEIVDDDERDSLRLGRYYVRAGWLLRELAGKKEELEEQKKKLEAKKKDLTAKAEKEGKDKKEIEELKNQIDREINDFEANRKEIEEKYGKELSIVNNLNSELSKIWKDLPTSEEGFIRKALDYLNVAYVNHPGIKNPAAAMDMLLWLSGIYLKINDQEKGLTYLNNVIQTGQKQKIKIETRLKNPNISEEDVRNLSMQEKKISLCVSKARDWMQDIQYQKFKAQKAEAKKIYDKIADREPEEIREILAKKGYPAKVVDSIVPEKKKKLFGLF